MRWFKRLLIVIIVLSIIYFSGPHPVAPKYDPAIPAVPSVEGLEKYIAGNEALHKLRPNNEARIVWANDTLRQKTPYSIVYLHGFSASQEEGNPVHRNIASMFGCNLYLSRLAEHGIDTSEQLLNLTVDNYWESAKQALAIGKQLGDKVILMGTSTGATQSLQLAATFPGDVAGLVLYSPNIAIHDPFAWMLNDPWGLQIARLVKGSKYLHPVDERPAYKQYWNSPYRLEALVTLEEMLETSMNKKTFSNIKQPTLLLYYYKDEKQQDSVVQVSAMKKMFEQLATPIGLKREMALPNTGDHVIASPIKSRDVENVRKETYKFLEDIMKLPVKHLMYQD
jgi:pimeloyl-ACP methyl ester carboxylesterase